MFELPVKEVHSIVSRMIIKEELLVRLNTHVGMSHKILIVSKIPSH